MDFSTFRKLVLPCGAVSKRHKMEALMPPKDLYDSDKDRSCQKEWKKDTSYLSFTTHREVRTFVSLPFLSPPTLTLRTICTWCARAHTHTRTRLLVPYECTILYTRARIYRRSFATASRYEIAVAVAKARCSRWDRGLSWSRAEHGVDCDRSIDRCQ